MPRLFTYIIPIDDGAAPNPFGGICTLNICKPGIRRVAAQGDWVAGLGAKTAKGGDLNGRLVYAMQVTKKISMVAYDAFAKQNFSKKIPDLSSNDLDRRLGDSIYDFETTPPSQRDGVHKLANQPNDLSGNNCLLSDHFVYFGQEAIELPDDLKPIIFQGRGHRSTKNAPYVLEFEKWIERIISQGKPFRGQPGYPIDWAKGCGSGCVFRQDDADNEDG